MDKTSESILINRGWDYKGITPPADWNPWCFDDDGEGFCLTERIVPNVPQRCFDCPRRKKDEEDEET